MPLEEAVLTQRVVKEHATVYALVCTNTIQPKLSSTLQKTEEDGT